MRDEKNITQEEFTGATFNVYCRNVKELSSPFCNKQSPVYKAGLRLISIEIKRTPCLCNTAWIESGKSKGILAQDLPLPKCLVTFGKI